MSRVGKKPIPLPKGVKVAIGDQLQVEGPKGRLAVPIPPGIRVEQKDNHLELVRDGHIELRQDRAFGPIWLRRADDAADEPPPPVDK